MALLCSGVLPSYKSPEYGFEILSHAQKTRMK